MELTFCQPADRWSVHSVCFWDFEYKEELRIKYLKISASLEKIFRPSVYSYGAIGQN